jgi:excisionase family DNA binding protein
MHWVYIALYEKARETIKLHMSYSKPMCTLGFMPPEPKWMSSNQAAERLGVSLRTLYKFVDEGLVPAYKFGRVIRLREHEIDAFIEASRIAPGTLDHLYPDAKGGSSDEF